MPTDKALAVMTLQHHAGIARLAGNEEVNESEGYHPYGVSAKHLRDIESVVRHLVDHPERLAGEGYATTGNPESGKPTVYHDGAGVSHVRAADILTSRSGQAEIQKAANYAVTHQLRPAAGEDEVVVKRKEYDALLAESRRVDYAQEHLIAADFAYGAEGEEVCALVIEIPKTARVIGDFRHSIDSLLAGSPTAQESKE